jgi:hypothetical protein
MALELTALAHAAVRETARLVVIAGALGDDVLTRGVLTGKGQTRASVLLYLKVLDRFTRCAALLGLERRSRPVDLADYLRQRADEELPVSNDTTNIKEEQT